MDMLIKRYRTLRLFIVNFDVTPYWWENAVSMNHFEGNRKTQS